MKRRLQQLRSLPRSRKLLLAMSVGAVAATAAAVALERTGIALVPVAALLAVLAAYLVILERRVLSAVRRVDGNLSSIEQRLDPDRIEFMQQRILASIETERLEVAERFERLH
ncbi:hypothetical protein GCM10027447_21440 [Glycomyces halotolerans]